MITKLTPSQREIVDNNSGLQRYLVSLERGKEFTPRSWLYERKDPDEVLASWKDILSRLEKGTEFDKNVFQFDISQEAKWGPQGGVQPIKDLMEIVSEGFKLGASPRPKVFESQGWKWAKDSVRSGLTLHLNKRLLRPASYHNVVDDMRARDTLESNSGWPLFTRRSKPEVKEHAIAAAENGEWKQYPAIALFRNYNQKTRLVWMFPMAANLVEGSFFQPLQSALINAGTPWLKQRLAPWTGFEAVRDVVSEVYNRTRDYDGMYISGIHTDATNKRDAYIAASDFSSTDAHFSIHHSMEVYDVIKDCFQPQYRDALRESIEHMHSIPLVIGTDSIIEGLHGVSSGSNWTNFIETIFDLILGEYVNGMYPFRKEGSRSKTGDVRVYDPIVKPTHPMGAQVLYAIGDDMAWVSYPYEDAFAEYLEQVGEQVGQIIRADKTTNEPNRVKSLQRLFQRGYNRPDGKTKAVYSTIRALKSSVYPERFHDPRKWSSDMFCARQYMILENCVDHPLFEEFVSFVVHGQKDLIPFAKKSKSDLDRILRESKLLPGLNPTYNQERRDQSLADFESIKLASKL